MIKVKVPATSANLGSGFDTIGLALDLHNEFTFYGEERGERMDPSSLIYQAAKRLFDEIGSEPEYFSCDVEARVPASRGLGSSACCIVGGLMGANAYMGDPCSQEMILKMAVEIEGHPDNVAPALLGGCIFSLEQNGKIYHQKVEGLKNLLPVVAIPNYQLETKAARAALPEHLSYQQAVHNMSHFAFLLEGLRNSRIDFIQVGAEDMIHEPYRKELIPGYETMGKIEEIFPGKMVISGAGPTLLFLTDGKEKGEEVAAAWRDLATGLDHKWDIRPLQVDELGAYYID